jgi:hypothetical protein
MRTAISTRNGEHVLVVGAEQREVRVVGAALGDRLGPRLDLAQVGEIADVTRAERLDEAEQHAAEHRARQVADAAEHRAEKALRPRMKPIWYCAMP